MQKLTKYAGIGLLLEAIVFVSIAAFIIYTHQMNIRAVGSRSDIGIEFRTAVDIRRGINPYARISETDLLLNKKFATLLPTYYDMLLLIAHVSDYNQDAYLNNFRLVLYASQIIGALFLYLMFRRKNHRILGFLAVGFFLLNRWSIDATADLKQDSIAIMFLLSSLYYFGGKPRLGYFLYGLSLAIKQIGIFAFPVFLLPFLYRKKPIKELLFDFSYVLIPTLMPALPFLADSFKGFVLSMLFSTTRAPVTNSTVSFGYERVLIKYNPTGIGFLTPLFYLLPRIILISMYLGTMFLMFTKKLRPSFFLFAAFLIFATFNPVVFDQYLVWAAPFVFYAVVDYL